MSSKLIITSHHPWQYRVKLALLGFALVLFAWGVFEFGLSRGGYDNDNLYAQRELLREQVSMEKQRIRDLRAQLAVLKRASQIDRQAYDTVEKSLKQVQDEMLELKQEVAFYQGIVSPTEAASGLTITSLKLTSIGEARVYRFKLVLTQLKSNVRLVKGYARLKFEGVKDGAQMHLSLKDISGGALDKLKLRFRYFQNSEGEIVLPEGFLPSRVLVEVVPGGKGMTRLRKTFDWSDVSS